MDAKDYWIERHEYLSAAQNEIERRALEPKSLCWLFDEETGHDGDEDYCSDCATQNADDNTEIMHGGWYESDGVRVCEKCGALLTYVLTDYGVRSELDYFLQLGVWDWNNANECAEIARIIGGIVGSGWFDVEEIDPDIRAGIFTLLQMGINAPELTRR